MESLRSHQRTTKVPAGSRETQGEDGRLVRPPRNVLGAVGAEPPQTRAWPAGLRVGSKCWPSSCRTSWRKPCLKQSAKSCTDENSQELPKSVRGKRDAVALPPLLAGEAGPCGGSSIGQMPALGRCGGERRRADKRCVCVVSNEPSAEQRKASAERAKALGARN